MRASPTTTTPAFVRCTSSVSATGIHPLPRAVGDQHAIVKCPIISIHNHLDYTYHPISNQMRITVVIDGTIILTGFDRTPQNTRRIKTIQRSILRAIFFFNHRSQISCFLANCAGGGRQVQILTIMSWSKRVARCGRAAIQPGRKSLHDLSKRKNGIRKALLLGSVRPFSYYVCQAKRIYRFIRDGVGAGAAPSLCVYKIESFQLSKQNIVGGSRSALDLIESLIRPTTY